MKNRTIRQHLAVSFAIVTLAASTLACEGWDLIWMTFFPKQYWDQQAEQEMRERGDAEPEDLWGQISGETEGEFVPPVAPVLPPQQVAPQANAPVGGPAHGAPVITDIDFPSTIPANGATYDGWVSFTDADGDVSGLRLHVLHSTTPMSDWEGRPKTLEGTTFAGRYRIGFYCTTPSLHSMQVTLFDAAGNTSNSMDFAWECR